MTALWTESLAAFYLAGGLANVIAVILFRALPFLFYACSNARHQTGSLAILGVLSAVLAGALTLMPVPWLPKLLVVCFGLLYFVLLTVSVHFLASSPGRGGFAKLALFVGLFLLCVVVPARALPIGLAPTTVIVAHGFELTLAGYSYCCTGWSSGRAPRLREGLFFMLVTPELVFPVQGEVSRGGLVRGTARALGGMLLMLAAVVVEQTVEVATPPLRLGAWSLGILSGAIAFLLMYASHSALAHLQIGLCRVVGYRAPERYRFPFAAVSPRDFWNRWNLYIGSWLRWYVFTPLIRALGTRPPRSLRVLIATLGAFFFLGIFHDAFWFVTYDRTVFVQTAGFVVWGFVLWLWRPLDDLIESPQLHKRMLARGVSRLSFACSLCIGFWIFR